MIKTSVGRDLRDETQILHTLRVLRDIHKTVVPQGLHISLEMSSGGVKRFRIMLDFENTP